MNLCTLEVWRGSVVRMKSSLEMSRAAHEATYRLLVRSTHSWGDSPCSSAARAIFRPCSSVPVRNHDVVADQPVPTGERVGVHRRVRRAEMGGVVDVVDGCGQEEAVRHALKLLAAASERSLVGEPLRHAELCGHLGCGLPAARAGGHPARDGALHLGLARRRPSVRRVPPPRPGRARRGPRPPARARHASARVPARSPRKASSARDRPPPAGRRRTSAARSRRVAPTRWGDS